MVEYREPLFRARKIRIYLTNHERRKLHNIFGFPEEPEQLLAILRSDLSEGYFDRYNKSHYTNGEKENYKIDFTNYSASIILIQDHGYYKAISAFKRKRTLILEGGRREIDWIYTPKKENTGSLRLIKTYKHGKTKRKHGKEKTRHIFQ